MTYLPPPNPPKPPKPPMATIRFAVIAQREGEKGYQVEHLYQHRADAEKCALAYRNQLQQTALVVELESALAVARRADAWAVANWDLRQLRLHVSRDQAEASLKPGTSLIETPIRRGMPVQSGVPQFAPDPSAVGP